MIRSLALIAGCALVAWGCGDGDEQADDGGTGAAVQVTERATGNYAYVEGYLSFVELSRGETVVADEQLTNGAADLEVAPGSYRMRFYLQPCGGNCETLDPPTGECVRRLDLSEEGEYAVVVQHSLGPDTRCQVATTRRAIDGPAA